MDSAKGEDTSKTSYPPFIESPYWVPDTERTTRWWYADGLWIDQGSAAIGVGVAWTHWLADRGVRLPEGNFDRDYAVELNRESRRLLDLDESEDAGTYVDTVAKVLRSRHLIDECYSCVRFDEVRGALLERGPVVAGIGWRKAMFAPREIDGWALLRIDREDSELIGSHCVVLNGIALDLEINGVTGFVRLKNSWGPDWGDGGHAMISIDDLRKVLLPETYFPVAAAAVLGPGLRRDVATDVASYGVPQMVYEQSAIGGDLWTERDTLGASAYADAIARGIQHVETKPPLTIGIKGAWGAGKTSLMRMIQQRLEWPGRARGSNEPRQIRLVGAAEEMTNRAVLKKAKQASAGDRESEAADAPAAEPEPASADSAAVDPRWRPTVWFNPWKYQTSEQIWAGLAHEIIEQITARMDRREREQFWLDLNLMRVDEQAVRRRVYGLILSRVVPYAVLGLVLLVAGIALLLLGQLDAVGRAVAATGPVAFVLGAGATTRQVFDSRISTDLSGLVGPASGLGKTAGAELASMYESTVEHPDYRARSGALCLLHADVKRVLDLVVTDERPLVVFIDDLDRCSPGSVVQVIEAINLFVAGDYPNTIFVIAMEPEMVAAHVEAVYSDLAKQLSEMSDSVGQTFDLGWRFLDKIVQLPLAVPTMEEDRTEALFESLFGRESDANDPPEESAEERTADREKAKEIGEASLSEALAMAGDVRPSGIATEAVRQRVERKLTIDDPEVREVLTYASRHLHHNPREIKRFANLFRFYTMIYTERRLEGLPAPASLQEIAKLAVLGIRWPGLLSTLSLPSGNDGGHTIFELIEDPPESSEDESHDQALRKALEAAGIGETTTDHLMTAKFKQFLGGEPKVGLGIRGYL